MLLSVLDASLNVTSLSNIKIYFNAKRVSDNINIYIDININ